MQRAPSGPRPLPEASPFEAAKDGVRVRIRLAPKARREGLGATARDASGACYLKAQVTAPAEGGKANRALIRLLANEWGFPPSRIALASGAQSRNKTLVLAGESSQLLAQLVRWLKERHG